MAQISSGNGLLPGSPGLMRPRGVVGKEEALRMEEEALAKLQREKRPTSLSSSSSSSSLSSNRPSQKPDATTVATATGASGRPEKDLIVFPEAEAKKRGEKDALKNIDVNKLTNEELEKILLDTTFDTNMNSKVTRPSSLLGHNLSASYPGGHGYSPVPFQQQVATTSPWNSISITSTSALSTPTHPQAAVFPSAPFSKPACSFQNGFTPPMPTYLSMPSYQQPAFMPFTPIQTPVVFQPPAVSPEMAKLFDKITSTSEYLKNERSSSLDLDSAPPKSLEPVPPPAPMETPSISRFDWLDLDPLSMRRGEQEEEASGAASPPDSSCPPRPGSCGDGGAARDPWDAVLLDEPESKAGPGTGAGAGVDSAPDQVKASHTSTARRASTGTVTRSHSLNIPATSSNHHNQVRADIDRTAHILRRNYDLFECFSFPYLQYTILYQENNGPHPPTILMEKFGLKPKLKFLRRLC